MKKIPQRKPKIIMKLNSNVAIQYKYQHQLQSIIELMDEAIKDPRIKVCYHDNNNTSCLKHYIHL
jgi:hypothetical protein